MIELNKSAPIRRPWFAAQLVTAKKLKFGRIGPRKSVLSFSTESSLNMIGRAEVSIHSILIFDHYSKCQSNYYNKKAEETLIVLISS